MKNNQSSISESRIEKRILLQILILSSVGILFYLIKAIWIVPDLQSAVESVVALLVYVSLALLVYLVKKGRFVKDVVIFFTLLSIIAGFFVLGGFNGVAAFDLCNMFIFVSVIYHGNRKNNILWTLLIILVVLVFVQLNYSHLVIDRSINDPDWLNILNVLLRFILIFNMGVAFREAYTREHKKVNELLEEVQTLNKDVTAQNEELQSMQEELKSQNEGLETLVNQRTLILKSQNETLVMYAYMNSHIFRGPISRIQGLLNLMEIEKNEGEKEKLYRLLLQEVHSVDKVIKDISSVLYEQDLDLMEELKQKAKRLYGLPDGA